MYRKPTTWCGMGETESWREVLEVIEVVTTMEFQAAIVSISTIGWNLKDDKFLGR